MTPYTTTAYTTIIAAQQLFALQTNPARKVVLIDCRYDLGAPDAGRQAYETAHLPGALYANLEHDLAGGKQAADGSFKGRHPLPERSAWLATLRGWGVTDDTQVVAYDAQGSMFAARLWWMLRWVGHSPVAVLDGGIGAWQQQGYAVEAATGIKSKASPSASNFTGGASLVTSVDVGQLTTDLAARSTQSQQFALVDARSAERYRGENETLDRVGGHIPGAKNRFFKDNLQSDGRFKPADALRAEWQPLLDEKHQNVMQCGSGVTACHNLLALEIAGFPGAALYPGSWSEWCGDAARPVATGAGA